MYARALFDIIHTSGDAALRLLEALEGGADELFDSTNTLAVVEESLLNVAHTLAHLPPVVMLLVSALLLLWLARFLKLVVRKLRGFFGHDTLAQSDARVSSGS